MAHYRAYLVGRDSNFIKAVDLDCVDDAAAKMRFVSRRPRLLPDTASPRPK